MNVNFLLKFVEPHLRNRRLTYTDFDEIFCRLPRRKQYLIAEALHENGIELVDEYDQSAAEQDVLQQSPSSKAQPVEPSSQSSVRQSNEVLCSLIQEGDLQAQQELCIKNGGLVAREMHALIKCWNHDLDKDDLMQAGMIGLLTAAKKFSSNLGWKFSTYATWWIRHEIRRTIYYDGFSIRLPVHVFEKIGKVLSLSRQLLQKLGHQPAIEELAAHSDDCKPAEIEMLVILAERIRNKQSLDAPINEDGDTTFGASFADEEYNLEDEVLKNLLHEEIAIQFETLKPRESEVLCLRYGIDGGGGLTLEQIGQMFGLTRERIRQIEVKALNKLRHPSRNKKLRSFYYD